MRIWDTGFRRAGHGAGPGLQPHPMSSATHQARQQIIEELYEEALVLADEARAVFNQRAEETESEGQSEVRIALSIEGLRTTTRLMHVLAWLLNYRAFLSGELNEEQMRRHGELPSERPRLPGMIEKLQPMTRELVQDSERLYARIARIDTEWRAALGETSGPVAAMQTRLKSAFT